LQVVLVRKGFEIDFLGVIVVLQDD